MPVKSRLRKKNACAHVQELECRFDDIGRPARNRPAGRFHLPARKSANIEGPLKHTIPLAPAPDQGDSMTLQQQLRDLDPHFLRRAEKLATDAQSGSRSSHPTEALRGWWKNAEVTRALVDTG